MILEQMPKTKWIWIPEWKEEVEDACHLVYFRKKFQINELPESCKIRISADSRYKLYVNGKFVEIGPSRGDRQVWYVDEIEIVSHLQYGENVLAVEVLRYPLSHTRGNHGIFRTATPGLYVESKQNGISADASWKCKTEKDFQIVTESPFFAPLQILEERCGNPEDAGWKTVGYDDSRWQDAVPYNIFQISQATSPGNLVPRTIPYMRKELRHFKETCGNFQAQTKAKWNCLLKGEDVVKIPAHSHEIMEINAGELNTGYLSLRMAKGQGAVVRILTSEGYVQREKAAGGMMPLPKKADRCDWERGYLHGFTDTYHVGGYGSKERTEDYEPFWFRTFRFLQLDISTEDEDIVLVGLDYQETGYPLEVKTQVQTSDGTLEPVWDISLRTLRRCMHETYEDCPFYEQLQYAMDSRSQILYTYMVSGDDRLARKCMDDFRRSQRYDGMINCSYPCYGPNVIPGFSIYYILMLHDHMMYFGDKDFLREHMGAIDGIMEYFNRSLEERGLVGKTGGLNGRGRYWSFIDWTVQWNKTTGVPSAILQGPITMESLLYILGLVHGADIMEYLGRKDTAEEYRKRADAVRFAVNRYCTDEEGMYLDGPGVKEYSQHCQVFAILTDTVSAEQGKKFLKKTLDNKEEYAQCSVAMAYYLFRSLEKAGLYEETDGLWNLWRDMVRKNLTTCVEDSVKERSDCHAWGALALYEIPAVVLGVRPGAPGYEEIEVKPIAGHFTWAKGEVVTKQGMVRVSWKKKEDGSLDLQYELPERKS